MTTDSSLSVVRQYDAVLSKLRAAQAVAHILSNDHDLEEVILNVANHLWQLGHDAETELDKMLDAHRAETEPKPEAPAPEWTPASADIEEKRIGALILRLPYDSIKRLCHFALHATTAKRKAGDPAVMSEADMAELLRRDHSLDTIDSFSFLKHQGDAALVDKPEPPKSLAALEHEIKDEIEDIKLTLDQNDLPEQEGVTRDYLVDIGAKAKELAAMLNDLCGTEHQ